MSSLAAVALLVAGLVLVVGGAEIFFDGLLAAAARLRVAPFVLTALVSGLELENLAAGIAADLKGLPGAAAGTFLGGTTFIALAVAGLAGALAPIRARISLPVLIATAAAPLPLVAVAADGKISRVDGGLLLSWFVLVLGAVAYFGRGIGGEERPRRKRYAAVRVLAGVGILSAGGEVIGEGIQRTVSRLGVSQTLLGNTAIAAAVEAEEVARVAVSARHGRGDVAMGNLVGTIPHFVALNAGVIALVRPLRLDDASLEVHLPAAAASTALLAAIVAVRGGIGRLECVLLLALYGGYVAASIIAG